jgi:PAS domain S-box-containing protein
MAEATANIPSIDSGAGDLDVAAAESVLGELADVFFRGMGAGSAGFLTGADDTSAPIPSGAARYQTLVEQIPAVVFMAYLDRGIGEAYVSPRIEEALGFTQEEWLQDPVRWYNQIHPEDKQRWSGEAAEMFLTGKPLKSSYRVIARDGRVVWFHCEAKMVRKENGRPWFIHGVGFDITDLKRTEVALEEERNLMSAILDTVGALVVVLRPDGSILRFNRTCEVTSGYRSNEVRGRSLWDLLMPADATQFREIVGAVRSGKTPSGIETEWVSRAGERSRIAWSITAFGRGGVAGHVVATGIDITERKRMEKAVLEISAREQRQIGQDLHDGLGQHLTGIAFMSKVLAGKLAERSAAESTEAAKIVQLVNEAINKTRELARGLLPVLSESDGLSSALRQWASEVEDLFHVSCQFHCERPLLIRDVNVATHLYHIAHEAVNNALKHGAARHIDLELTGGESGAPSTLVIRDDGVGIGDVPAGRRGLGLHIMTYRAGMIGGSLEIGRAKEGACGTVVRCRFPGMEAARGER